MVESSLSYRVGVLMSLGIGDPGLKKAAKKTLERKGNPPPKEMETRTLDFFGWDADGSVVDTMDDFRRINISIAVASFGRYGVTPFEAGLWYDADRSAAGTRFIQEIGNFHRAPSKKIKAGVLEVRDRLSKQQGPPIPNVDGIMFRIKRRQIGQFVCTSGNSQDTIAKLEHAGLMRHLDPDLVVGEDSGEPGQILSKGEPQLRVIASRLASKGLVKDYDDFVRRAGYFGDTIKDMIVMIPCSLKLLIGFADKATPVQDMIRVGAGLPMDRFRVVTARTIQDIVPFIDLINRVEAVNFP